MVTMERKPRARPITMLLIKRYRVSKPGDASIEDVFLAPQDLAEAPPPTFELSYSVLQLSPPAHRPAKLLCFDMTGDGRIGLESVHRPCRCRKHLQRYRLCGAADDVLSFAADNQILVRAAAAAVVEAFSSRALDQLACIYDPHDFVGTFRGGTGAGCGPFLMLIGIRTPDIRCRQAFGHRAQHGLCILRRASSRSPCRQAAIAVPGRDPLSKRLAFLHATHLRHGAPPSAKQVVMSTRRLSSSLPSPS